MCNDAEGLRARVARGANRLTLSSRPLSVFRASPLPARCARFKTPWTWTRRKNLRSCRWKRPRDAGSPPVDTGWHQNPASERAGGARQHRPVHLRGLVRWVRPDGRLHTNQEIVAEVTRELGFARRGAKIVAAIETAVKPEGH